MSKILVKSSLDMNDGDYIYGVKVWDKYEYEKYKSIAMLEEEIGKFAHNCVRNWSPTEVFDKYIKTIEVTEQQIKVLEELGLSDFGDTYLPCENDILYEEEED